jgi:hypothetical protein
MSYRSAELLNAIITERRVGEPHSNVKFKSSTKLIKLLVVI